ncbi:RNA polymerase sigma factor [Flavihumibacter sp. UBA7668]|uniref:RNA polymerase sigma factor n=1 Tax=Flavihumibacter sp. UBA7668 TaxID=1946542 RepID=UPI0025C3E5D4|nr:sigma-70 family RNA polymerase sigma factor [Flavihumibacter sp. UBA7668]
MQPLQSIESKEDFTQLFEQYWEGLYAYTLRCVKREEIAQDLVQDLFAQVWIKRKKIKVQENWQRYLFTAIKNRITDYHRANKIQTIPLPEEDRIEYGNSTRNEHLSLPESRLALRSVQLLSKQLTPTQELVFKLYRFQGFSIQEISQQLTLSENTVKSHIQESTRKIRLLSKS